MQTTASQDSQDNRETTSKLRNAVGLARKHRTISTLVAVSVVVAAATPFVAQAAGNQSSKGNSSSSSVKVETNVSNQQPANDVSGQAGQVNSKQKQNQQSNNNTSVTVNGQPVRLSDDGNYSSTSSDGSSHTSVQVNNSQTSVSASSSSSGSHVNISVNSESSSDSADSSDSD